ncbi:ion channel [Sessilibacter corallicola]|uniref:ion channel n=1 Tax=Sessilibacter corallicola TaxID=2904075 RepID=UPI003312FDED
MLVSIYIAIVGFAAVYKQKGLVSGSDVIHDASTAFYFSVVTWTTLGYGDFQPTESIRWLAALEALLGTLFIPLFLASIIFILQSTQSHNQVSKETK